MYTNVIRNLVNHTHKAVMMKVVLLVVIVIVAVERKIMEADVMQMKVITKARKQLLINNL